MYAAFPQLPLAGSASTIDVHHEQEDPTGCVKATELRRVGAVRIGYAAVCHLAQLAQDTTSRHSVFGRLCGLQIGETVDITDVCPTPLRESQKDQWETDIEMQRRIDQERADAARAVAELSRMQNSEELDAYQVGQFVIASATYNPYSMQAINELMRLYDSSQPMVLLTYDPFRTSLFGKPFLRAFVPTDEYLVYHRLTASKSKDTKFHKLVRESHLTRSGVLREVPLEVDVDAYQVLGLTTVEVAPVPDNFYAIQADIINDYVEALVNSVRFNSDKLKSSLETENRNNLRESNGAQPLAQRVDTLLALQHLREQTQHLEGVCDSVLLNSSFLRDL